MDDTTDLTNCCNAYTIFIGPEEEEVCENCGLSAEKQEQKNNNTKG